MFATILGVLKTLLHVAGLFAQMARESVLKQAGRDEVENAALRQALKNKEEADAIDSVPTSPDRTDILDRM